MDEISQSVLSCIPGTSGLVFSPILFIIYMKPLWFIHWLQQADDTQFYTSTPAWKGDAVEILTQ